MKFKLLLLELISKAVIFKTSDYNLNLEERKAKYKNYKYVLCEKCNKKIDKWNYYCSNCYYRETDRDERNRMKYGSKVEIFKTLDYDLNRHQRKSKYKNHNHVLCEKCNQEID